MLPVTVMAGRITCLPKFDNYTSRGGGIGLGQRSSEATCSYAYPQDSDPREHPTFHDNGLSSEVPREPRLKYPDVYIYLHMCGCESMSPCVSPCPLQYLHAVFLCVVFGSLRTSMLSVYESYGVLWCICLHVDSLYVSVPASVLPMCLHVVSVQSACVCVCLCRLCVCLFVHRCCLISVPSLCCFQCLDVS